MNKKAYIVPNMEYEKIVSDILMSSWTSKADEDNAELLFNADFFYTDK